MSNQDLLKACENGDLKFATQLLSSKKVDINCKDIRTRNNLCNFKSNFL